MSFWAKFALYLLPFALGTALVTGALIYVGESMPLSWVVAIQQENPHVIYRPWFGNRDIAFKALTVNTRQPEIIALGSSRILQFRAGLFHQQPQAFYNAAVPGAKLSELNAILDQITVPPQILLLAIDPPWFLDDYEGLTFPAPVNDFQHVFAANRSVLQALLAGERFTRNNFDPVNYLKRYEPVTGTPALGLRAIRDGHAFRADGSEQYGDFLVAGWLWQPQMRDNHLQYMRDGEQMYLFGDVVSPKQYALLLELLDWAKRHEITVIGFLPSYMPTLWEEMLARGNHAYIPALTQQLTATFAEYGYPFLDYSNGAQVDTPDSDFFDGWHASELGNLRLYLYLLGQNQAILGRYSDVNTLQNILYSGPNTWDVFGLDGLP